MGTHLQCAMNRQQRNDRSPSQPPTFFGGCFVLVALIIGSLATLRLTSAVPSSAYAPFDPKTGSDVSLPLFNLPRAAPFEAERLPGAALLFRSPYRGDCPALGALEAGRSFSVIEQRSAWVMIDAEGSGRVWVRAETLPMGDQDGRLTHAVIAYARPGDTRSQQQPDDCTEILGIAAPGTPYALLQRAGRWSKISIDGSVVWTDAIP